MALSGITRTRLADHVLPETVIDRFDATAEGAVFVAFFPLDFGAEGVLTPL